MIALRPSRRPIQIRPPSSMSAAPNSASQKRAFGPYHADLSEPAGRRASSCAAGIRASWRDGDCSVGMSSVASPELLPKPKM